MPEIAEEQLAAAREAAAHGAWRDAYARLSEIADELGADDLERLAEAAYWSGRLEEAIRYRERAYTAHVQAGADERAATVALWISQDYFNKASLAVSAGWFAKAERLLEGLHDSPAHGFLAFARGTNALMSGDLDAAFAELDRALELAQRYRDRDLQAMVRVAKGRGLVLRGEMSQGLALLDEGTAAAVSGELTPYATGFIYCCTITSCHGVGDLRRAAEWTEAANRWCDRQDVAGFPGACRVHHASIMRLRGNWPQAEEQATQACDELQGYDAWTTAAGFYEIGEIRRRRGDFAAAEEAYAKAKEWGRDPQPGLALLRLAQGKVDAAVTAIRRSVGSSQDPIARIHRLPAHVTIELRAGNLRAAREAAEELETLVDRFRVGAERTAAFEATVCASWAEIRLAENDAAGAAAEAEHAIETWRSVGAPYEIAEAQTLLGVALRKLGDEDGARDELAAARATFERLGAVLDVQRVAELLGLTSARRTFVFTDIVDSTKLGEVLGAEKWEKLLTWHDRTVADVVSGHGGEVIKHTGDGYFAAFASPAAAIEAAVAIQRALDAHEPVAPDVRIGIHTGGAFHHGDDDYAGHGVNVAARVGSVAAAAEILVSRDSLDGNVANYPLSQPRALELKGVAEPVELVAVEWR